MQDLQSTGINGVRSLFNGGGGSLKCPRCGCLNTKFCYYNNYNLSQPRFFCKGCRRYWTNGGVLRNVPVGGRTRKIKQSNQKTGNRKPSCDRKSTNSQNSVVAANISPETTAFTPTETAPTLINQSFKPPMLDQCSTDNRHLLSELPLEFSSAPEMDSLRLVDERSHEVENGGDAAEGWGLFDQSYWMNNSDHQLNYFM